MERGEGGKGVERKWRGWHRQRDGISDMEHVPLSIV